MHDIERTRLSFFADESGYVIATVVSNYENMLVDPLRVLRKRFVSSEPTGNLFRPPDRITYFGLFRVRRFGLR